MKICIACVNFNSYDHLSKYLTSISNATSQVPSNAIELDVFVADNSVTKQPVKQDTNLNLHVVNNPNLGYIGGIKSITKLIDVCSYDYFIISNVDVCLSKSFFIDLLAYKNEGKIGWIAPSIISATEKKDRNPKVENRYSKTKMQIFQLLYSFPFLHYMYETILYPLKRFRQPSKPRMSRIYAGHGSFMIFTKSFLANLNEINYPVFLFGEELYFAEECLKRDFDVVYYPNITVLDSDHVSTSKMKKSFYYSSNLEAINYIYEHYYQ